MKIFRKTEMTAVTNRAFFEDPPNTLELDRWYEFRRKYNAASNLECGDFPVQIDFGLNSTCQMKCSFCTHGKEKVEKRFLTFDKFKKVIDESAEYGLCSIKLNHINEPLLNKDLPEYIKYAKSKGVLNVYFATNGLLLTEDMSRRLIDAGLSKLMVSLDATTPETFLKIRHSKHFNRIVENIHRFLEIRGAGNFPKLRVNFLETEINQHESEDFMASWSWVADSIGFQRRHGVPGYESGSLEDGAEFKCSFPFKQVVIGANGDILPCCTFSGQLMPIGHVDTDTIYQAWNSEKMNALRALHFRGGYAENPICKHCISG